MKDVLLGYEIPTGAPVRIPIRHMVVTGQTQAAGKTTALEALIARSGVRAVCFVTKRGEGSFTGARRIDPYFREQADWQFVCSLLEASRGERMKYERPWIIRMSKGATTLAQVHQNVRKALVKARGANEGAYICLDAYLEIVVPQIAGVVWATSVALGAGVNAMDLTALAGEMQHLVIRSTIEWVLHREENTVVVVPEAWKFIPQGRGTPVKLAAESYIRQGAGLKNYLWLDSQDIAGVDKTILKNVPVWVLGVQRESNEIKRTLDQIPANIKKPKPEQIATLGLGEFFACWESSVVKTFVQPAWMAEVVAIAIAKGQLKVSDASRPTPVKEQPVSKQDETTSEERIVAAVVKALASMSPPTMPPKLPAPPRPPTEPYEGKAPARSVESERGEYVIPVEKFPTDLHEDIYQKFRARMIAEAPAIIRLLVDQPEIEIKIERRTIETDQTSMMGMLATLLHEGYFDTVRKSGAAHKETQRRWGYGGAPIRTHEKLGELVSMGFVTKEADGYLAVAGIRGRIRTS